MEFKRGRKSRLTPSGQLRTPPAIHALVIQIISFFVCLSMLFISGIVLDRNPPLFLFILAQAAIAAYLSFFRGMDWWWWLIQFTFPILVVTFFYIPIPSYYYSIAFVFFTLLYWNSFRTQVPYFPSKGSLLPVIFPLLPDNLPVNFIDVGSGLGGLLIRLSAADAKSRFVGIEISPLLWIVSYLRGKISKSSVQFLYGNYQSIDFGKYDVVFAYLSPVVMSALWHKAKSEMRPGSLLLSYEFLIPDIEPEQRINLADNGPILYVWRI